MARTRWPSDLRIPASCTGWADQAGTAGGCLTPWGPADRSSRKTARTASAESEVRPGPRLPTLCPYPVKTGEAGPEVQSTSSLPGRKHYPHPPCRIGAADTFVVRQRLRVLIVRFWVPHTGCLGVFAGRETCNRWSAA